MCQTRNERPKKVYSHDVEENKSDSDESESSDDDIFIGTINTQEEGKEWSVSLNTGEKVVNFKIDTGAECNVISKDTFDRVKKSTLERSKVKLGVFGGKKLKTLGKTTLACLYKDKYWLIEFQVVNQNVPNILGLTTCLQLALVKRVLSINKDDNGVKSTDERSSDSVIEEYKDVFTGLGCIKGVTHHIKTDPDVKPVIHPPRRVPVALRQKVKDELDRLERLGVVDRVQEPTEWVNSLVTVVKPNGKIRLCIDPKDLNKAIRREHFPMRSIEEVVARMPNAKFFTKLDATHGFWQVQLDQESAKKCTFNTPFGRYRFNRLPFGISSAPEVFQRVMSQIFDDLEGVEVIVDDLLIWGETEEEHDRRLKATLDRAREAGIKLNKEKCEIGLTQVTYIGHTLSATGLKPDQTKVEAIQVMDKPEDKSAVQRFLGMVTYLAKFIPNFSQLAAPLRSLLEKDIEWHWDSEQENSFEMLKQAVTTAPVLNYYDTNQEVTLQVDASPNGLGAALLQNGKPVAYASKSLTRAQQNYAQIEKEMLAITFGCERFHDYIFGKEAVTVETDHKPLEFILKKPLYQAPQRLQKMILRTQKYSINVQYKPGKEMLIADALSRACKMSKAEEEPENEFQVTVIQMLPMSTEKVKEFQTATQEDKDLTELLQCIKDGWPIEKSKVPNGAKPYWNYRDEIVQHDGLLLKGHKVIVPRSLRPQMLQIIHNAHLGIEKCKRRSRDTLFWPGMNGDIEVVVKNCQICQDQQRRNTKQPLHPHDIPARPWAIVGADLFELEGESYLILVDYYSGFFEISKLQGTKSSKVIIHCKSQFARHGIPDKLVSDNGPQFSSEAFSEFAQAYGFTHTTSSPKYPQSNGLAERSVQTAKKLLKKSMQGGTDPYLALLSYRNTPVDDTLGSPAQRLMGRRTKTTLPTSSKLLQPEVINPNNVQEAQQKKKEKQKLYYDKHTKELPVLQPGDMVRYETDRGLKPAVVIQETAEPRSYRIKTDAGSILRRNRRHLYATGQKSTIQPEDDDDDDDEVVQTSEPDPPPAQSKDPSRRKSITGTKEPQYRTKSGRPSIKPNRYGTSSYEQFY